MKSVLSKDIGFYSLNNLNLAATNCPAALESNDTFIDGSMASSSASNLSLPYFFAILSKLCPDRALGWQ